MRQKSFSNLKRRKNFKLVRKNFLIVCEGEKTEPNYFSGFRVLKKVFDVIGFGANTESLVKKAIELRDNERISYDEVWCVFDRDSFPVHNFNNALLLARNNNIHVAYSNEAFEIWYLLHFYFHDAATSRKQYKKMLTDRLGFPYKKNDSNMYDHLLHLQDTAINNAINLLNSYAIHNPSNDNPSTNVHLLVQKLNENSV
ncbi:MAG: RloB family protein [Deltaproteobacteria bacterium]|nr:RloB family protein [Deltaproteobacteria bacterium]